ncbi:MAG TPA: WYL domain-containing protein [Gemmatimonadaceae bacterium]
MTAIDRFTRIVSLVAELSRSERDGADAPTMSELAARHGVSQREIGTDIRTLTVLGDHSGADWLLSLRIWQQGDQVSMSSAGPFRRPIRFSPEEQLAIQLALALEPGGAALAERFAAVINGRASAASGVPDDSTGSGERSDAIIGRAIREHRVLEIAYAGEVRHDVRTRLVQPYQLAEFGVRSYLVAWAPDVGAWRHFRLDRVLQVTATDTVFVPLGDFEPLVQPRDIFRPGSVVESVTVRFRRDVSAWVTEAFPEHRVQADGSVLVMFTATSLEWMTRKVLEFGADAEVVEPAHYRDAVRLAVA